jgi:hypothetical protein
MCRVDRGRRLGFGARRGITSGLALPNPDADGQGEGRGGVSTLGPRWQRQHGAVLAWEGW